MKQQTIFTTLISLFLGGLLFFAIAYTFALLDLPSTSGINSCFHTRLHSVYMCPSSKDYTPLKNIPEHVQFSLIVSEDASFYSHRGVDWKEIWNSMKKNISKGRWARGASTITQQLAKNVYLSGEKSLIRKFREYLLAKNLEQQLTKSQILEKYLNIVEFGHNLFGIKAAALFYFKKAPWQLTPAEGAFIISLLPSPARYATTYLSKRKLSDYNRQQVLITLERLHARKKISDRTYELEKERVNYGLWSISNPQDADSLFSY